MKATVSRRWVAALATLALAGCGGDGFDCGEGTIEVDGECVPMSTLMCGEGTVLDEDGETCVPESTAACGEGTTLNTETGECEPDITGCAPGTTAMGGECVPDGTVICSDGTEYDEETGTCVGVGEPCGEGTVLLDGECRPADEALEPDVFAAAENDDPLLDGTPGDFLPPAVGDTRTLGGCITPDDIDGDGRVDPDADWFGFSVSEAGLFRIHADGLGGASAAFAVFADSGPLADQGWFRLGINLVGDSSERQVYIPAAGNYHVAVFDSRSVGLESLVQGAFGFARAVGDEDTCYYVTVEAMPLPTPGTISGGTESDVVDGVPRFYELSPSARTAYRSVLEDDQRNAFMGQSFTVGDVVSVGVVPVEGPGTLVSSPVEASGTGLLVIDHVLNLSLDDVRWTVTVDEAPELPADGDVTITHDAENPSLFVFEASAGDVVRLTYDSGVDDVTVLAFGPDRNLATAIPLCFTAGGEPREDTNCEAWWVVQQSGSQIVEVNNPSAADGSTYDVDFDVNVQTPVDLTLGTPQTVTFVDDRTFVRADLSSSVWSRMAVSGLTGTGLSAVDVRFIDDDTAFLLSLETFTFPLQRDIDTIDSESAVSDGFSRIYGPEFGPPALIELRDPSGFDGDEELTVEIGDETFADVMVDPATPVARSGDAVPADGAAYYFVRGVPGGEVTFEVTGTGGTDPVIAQLDDVADPITPVTDDTGADGTESLTLLVPFEGWLAFEVTAGSTAGTVDVDISTTDAPYTAAPGTTPFVSICPAEGGSGTEQTLLDGTGTATRDDGITSPITFSTFTSATFFASAVSGAVISSNGWLTFETGYSDSSLPGNQPLATPGTPNAVVATLWDDLDDVTVCTLEESGRFVVEWNGHAFGDTGRTVQMQMILLGDGSIELVYGPLQRLLDDLATVGLESSDGSIGIDPGIGVMRNTSILFTPSP
ncbi:MAG TPA: EB domain-containing protein [Sandaracinaceae bacterium LLY-WYZ-13_1]|nr:EB domain-containing protein [Sandaracinaceae bacterium LLY-WYZ-13_1]